MVGAVIGVTSVVLGSFVTGLYGKNTSQCGSTREQFGCFLASYYGNVTGMKPGKLSHSEDKVNVSRRLRPLPIGIIGPRCSITQLGYFSQVIAL